MGLGYSTELPVNEIPSEEQTRDLSSEEFIIARNLKYGWRKDLPDHRDHTHTFSYNILNNLLSSEDLRKYMPPVYDQGELGSCTANAIAGAFQYDEMKQYREKLLKMKEEEKKEKEKEIFDKWSGILSNPKPITRSMSSKRRKKKKSKIVEKVIELNNKENIIFETEKKEKQRNPIIFTPSRLFIYYNERAMEGTVSLDTGASIRDGMKSVNKLGVCRESDWPYDISKFTEKPNESCYNEATGLKSKKYVKANTDLNHLKAYLKSGFPVIFGFIVFESFESDEVARTGHMKMPQPDEKRLGGHAVLLCGYDDKIESFIVRNSWGKDWGDNGYFYMPYEFVNTPGYCDDFWVMYTVTESNNRLLNNNNDKKQTNLDNFLITQQPKKVTLKFNI